MGSINVRNLSDETHKALRVRAAQHGRSMEAEVRAILDDAVLPREKSGLGSMLGSMRGDTVIVGISPDLPPKLAKFDEKYSLGFTLLSDPEHETAEAYGTESLRAYPTTDRAFGRGACVRHLRNGHVLLRVIGGHHADLCYQRPSR